MVPTNSPWVLLTSVQQHSSPVYLNCTHDSPVFLHPRNGYINWLRCTIDCSSSYTIITTTLYPIIRICLLSYRVPRAFVEHTQPFRKTHYSLWFVSPILYRAPPGLGRVSAAGALSLKLHSQSIKCYTPVIQLLRYSEFRSSFGRSRGFNSYIVLD